MQIGFWVIFASVALVVVEGFVAFFITHNFFQYQVIERWKVPGIAFIEHGGIWGDLILLPVVMGYVIQYHEKMWSERAMISAGLIGIALTLGNHINLVLNQKTPDPLGWQRESWSLLIALHFVYMSLYIALVKLFFLDSGEVPMTEAVVIAVILGIHVALGTHVGLGIIHRVIDRKPDFLASDLLPVISVGVWVTLAILATIASRNYQAGMAVLLIGGAFAFLVQTFTRFYPPIK